jgi:hypothetical protein
MTASSAIRQPGAEATMVLDKYLDALTADDLHAIAGGFAQDATWSIQGSPQIPADTAWRPVGALPPMTSDRASIVSSARSGCAPGSPTPTSASRWPPETFTIAPLRDIYAVCLGHLVSASNCSGC